MEVSAVLRYLGPRPSSSARPPKATGSPPTAKTGNSTRAWKAGLGQLLRPEAAAAQVADERVPAAGRRPAEPEALGDAPVEPAGGQVGAGRAGVGRGQQQV